MKKVNTAVKKAGDSTTQNVQPKVKDLNNFKKEKLEVVGKKKGGSSRGFQFKQVQA